MAADAAGVRVCNNWTETENLTAVQSGSGAVAVGAGLHACPAHITTLAFMMQGTRARALPLFLPDPQPGPLVQGAASPCPPNVSPLAGGLGCGADGHRHLCDNEGITIRLATVEQQFMRRRMVRARVSPLLSTLVIERQVGPRQTRRDQRIVTL